MIRQHSWLLVFVALAGASFGLKFVSVIEEPHAYWQGTSWIQLIRQGGTIVGAILGAYLFIEAYKKWFGIRRSSGDVLVFGLMIGIVIGRVGCFLAGRYDATYGMPTSLPWAVDFGDGIGRHPTQLYEIAFLMCVYILLNKLEAKVVSQNGMLFRLFVFLYMAWRLCIDALKPIPFVYKVAGVSMSGIQLVCCLALVWFFYLLYLDYKALSRG